MGQWRRRRTERALARLGRRIAALREEVAELDAQLGTLGADADDATTEAAVRPGGPTRREADRARSAHERHGSLLARRRDQLARAEHRRDELLEELVTQHDPTRRPQP